MLFNLSFYVFGLSLYSNYLIVCVLTYLRIYTPLSIYILFSIEIVGIIFFIIRGDIHLELLRNNKSIREFNSQLFDYIKNQKHTTKILFASSLFFILILICLIPINARNTFYFNDAINFWNRLALVWASNTFPLDTSHYPQLFTTNISLSYVFMNNNTVPFFIKALMPLFSIGILLIFLDLALTKKSAVYLAGLIIYAAILFIFYPILYILDANADILVSFFGFLTFYSIIKSGKLRFDPKGIFLAVTFASCAADTKMAGLYIFGLSLLG